MKIKKIISLAVVGTLMMLLVVLPIKPTFADTIDEQLAALTTAIANLGEAIRTSPTLTDGERLSLFTQLVALSNAILSLRQARDQRPTVTPPTKQTAEAVGLERIILRYEPRTYAVAVEVSYATSSKREFTLNYPGLARYENFNSQIQWLRHFAKRDISDRILVVEKDVDQLVFVTTRNPARDSLIIQNSRAAEDLATNFGSHSIVTRASILPSRIIQSNDDSPSLRNDQFHEVTIALYSDQEEALVTKIRRRSGMNVSEPEYTLSAQYMLLSTLDGGPFRSRDSLEEPLVIINRNLIELDEDELKKEVRSLFQRLPFTAQIRNYESKLFRFLFDQNSRLVVEGNRRHTESEQECYDSADLLVMRELGHYFLTEAVPQFTVEKEDVRILAPIRQEDFGNRIYCENVQRVF